MTPNVPLLRKVVEWVEEQAELDPNERLWTQWIWLSGEILDDKWCGTAMCVAGKVALESGWLPRYQHDNYWMVRGGVTETVKDAATSELGLTTDQAEKLFYENNTAPRIREVAEEIAGERL